MGGVEQSGASHPRRLTGARESAGATAGRTFHESSGHWTHGERRSNDGYHSGANDLAAATDELLWRSVNEIVA